MHEQANNWIAFAAETSKPANSCLLFILFVLQKPDNEFESLKALSQQAFKRKHDLLSFKKNHFFLDI